MQRVEEYLDRVCSELLLSPGQVAEIREELLRHFQDGIRERVASGMTEVQATSETLEQTGAPEDVAKRFRQSYRKRFLKGLAIWLGGAGTLLACFFLADGISRGPADHGRAWSPNLNWLVALETLPMVVLGSLLLTLATLGFPNPRRALRDGRFWRNLSEYALLCGSIEFLVGMSYSIPFWLGDRVRLGHGLFVGIVGLTQGILICFVSRSVPCVGEDKPSSASGSGRVFSLIAFLGVLCATVWIVEGAWPWEDHFQTGWPWEYSFDSYSWITLVLLGGLAAAGLRDGFSKTFETLRQAWHGVNLPKIHYARLRNLGLQFALLGGFAFFAITVQGLENLSESGEFERRMISAFGCLGLGFFLCIACRVYAGAGPSNRTSKSGFLRRSGTEQPEAA